MSRLAVTLVFGALIASTCVQSTLAGVDGPGGESAWNAAEGNYAMAEFGRQSQIARQLELNYRLRWSTGYGLPYGIGYPIDPWPRMGSDIWGYRGSPPVEHPLGYETIQSGPNRLEYRPIYARDLAPPSVVPVPATSAPSTIVERPAPSDARELPAPGPSRRREF